MKAWLFSRGERAWEFAYDDRHGCLTCSMRCGLYSLRPGHDGGIWVAVLLTNLAGEPVWRPSEIKPIKIVFSDGAEYLFPVEGA